MPTLFFPSLHTVYQKFVPLFKWISFLVGFSYFSWTSLWVRSWIQSQEHCCWKYPLVHPHCHFIDNTQAQRLDVVSSLVVWAAEIITQERQKLIQFFMSAYVTDIANRSQHSLPWVWPQDPSQHSSPHRHYQRVSVVETNSALTEERNKG